MHNTIRTRWAAIGAAVAVTLGAGGLSFTQAAEPTDGGPVYVSLEQPCRVVDTRPGSDNIGDKSTPIGPGASNTYTIQITGENGECIDGLAVPAEAVGVALNLTAIDNTAQSHLRVYPADADLPLTSNLNFGPAQDRIANKVDVGLSSPGEITIYNHAGETHAAVDIFGYYINHQHTGAQIVDESLTGADIQDGTITSADIADESFSGADVEDETLTGTDVEDGTLTGADVEDGTLTGADIQDGTLTNADTIDEPGIAYSYEADPPAVLGTPGSMAETSIRVPSDGQVEVMVTGAWQNDTAGVDAVDCQLQKGGVTAIATGEPMFKLNDLDANVAGAATAFSAHRVLPISVADNPVDPAAGQPLHLVCELTSGGVTLDDLHISATFYATSYAP